MRLSGHVEPRSIPCRDEPRCSVLRAHGFWQGACVVSSHSRHGEQNRPARSQLMVGPAALIICHKTIMALACRDAAAPRSGPRLTVWLLLALGMSVEARWIQEPRWCPDSCGNSEWLPPVLLADTLWRRITIVGLCHS